MSSELNGDARALIRDAVAAELPAGDARREGLKRVLLSRVLALAAPAAAATGAPEPSFDAGGAVSGGSGALPGTGGAVSGSSALPGLGGIGVLLAKGAAVGILVAGGMHGIARFGQQNAPAPSATYASARESTAAERPAAPPAETALNAATPSDRAATAPLAVSLGSAAPAAPSDALPSTAPPIDSAPSDAAPSLRAELELMAAAQAALRDGRSARSLELAERHAALYPNGQLVSERLAVEAVAACQRGDEARGRRAAEAFLRRDPTSAMAARVRGACASHDGVRDR